MERVRKLLDAIVHNGSMFIGELGADARRAQAALAVIDELEAAHPTWTTELPTESGLYLCYFPEAGTELVTIERDEEDNLFMNFGPGADDYEIDDLHGGIWLGSLPEPPSDKGGAVAED